MLFPFKYKDLGTFDKKGMAFAKNENGFYGYIDREDHILIPFSYWKARSFSGNYAEVDMGLGEKGVIDRAGNIVVPLKYNSVYICVGGIIEVEKRVESKRLRGLYDLRRDIMLPCVYEKIKVVRRDDEGILECECWKDKHSDPVVVKVNSKKIVNETIDIRKVSPEKLIENLLACFENDEELYESVKKYPERVSVFNQPCSCGGYVIRMYYCSSQKSWQNLAGRAGWLTICTKCRCQ